jgi:hypothetical protein
LVFSWGTKIVYCDTDEVNVRRRRKRTEEGEGEEEEYRQVNYL